MNNEFSNQVSNITIYSKFLGTALFKKQYAYIIKLCAALAIIVGIWKLFCNVLSLNAPDLLLQIIMLISIITATFVIFFQIFNKQDLVLNLGQNEHIEIRENEICLVNNETNEVLINSFFRNYDSSRRQYIDNRFHNR